MTNRANTLTVVLECPVRDDDCEHLINAIKMMKGVLNVEFNVANIDQYMAEERATRELGEKILAVLYPDIYSKKD